MIHSEQSKPIPFMISVCMHEINFQFLKCSSVESLVFYGIFLRILIFWTWNKTMHNAPTRVSISWLIAFFIFVHSNSKISRVYDVSAHLENFTAFGRHT